jgi:hypothetical protein
MTLQDGKNIDRYPHYHPEPVDAEIYYLPNAVSALEQDNRPLKEMLTAVASGAAIIGATVVIAETIDDKPVSEALYGGVGTAVLLGLVYASQPYLSNTRFVQRIEKWSKKRREAKEEKLV